MKSLSSNEPNFNYLKYGLHLLVVFWILLILFKSDASEVGKVFIGGFFVLSVILFAIQVYSFGGVRGKSDRIVGLLMFVFIFWSLVTVFRGISLDMGSLLTLLVNPSVGGLVWLLPFALYIGRQPGVLMALLPVFKLHCLIGIVFVVWGIFSKDNTLDVGLVLLYAAPVLLLHGLESTFDRYLYLFCMILTAVAQYILSGRAPFIISTVVILISIVLGQIGVRGFSPIKLIFAVIMSVVSLLVVVDYVLTNLTEDLLIDTRSFLLDEMYDDFNFMDWLIGRGALGSYYSPYFDMAIRKGLDGDWMYRQVNEIGYLHLVLKMGIIGVCLYFLIFARSAWLAISLQDKRVGIGLMIFFVLHLLEMLVAAPAVFNPSRLLLWIFVGIVLNQHNVDVLLHAKRLNKPIHVN